MARKKELSIKERKEGLIRLIKDAKQKGFSASLIKNYESQLKEIEQ